MAGFAKGILIAMLASVAMVIMMNLAFFFPWYITVIETGFEVSQIVANENYLPGEYYQNIIGKLREKPIFNKRRDEVIIKVIHKGNKSGIGEVGLDADDYYNMSENNKPYVQKGNPVTVTVEAAYPFQMELGGKEIDLADIKVSIPITTTTLKYYKDLYYYIEN